jgi:asparagine synthase (glutamine-hydrolysing)
MSVIFGIRKPVGDVVSEMELLRLAHRTERYAPDAAFVLSAGAIGMGFQPFHTTQRSLLEAQPVADGNGNLLVLDGRLDNHEELRKELEIHSPQIADGQLILAAFMRWDESCFSRLIGDWAIALWSAGKQVLYLARDHSGARTLFFRNVCGTVQWSTYLESFISRETSHSLDEEYVASYLGCSPIRTLTPHKGIRAVPPAHYVLAAGDTSITKPHWDWMARSQIRYRSDQEYEEHFLQLFETSVVRRTVPGGKILAQLSGGMDSTSIVCMSDYSRKSQARPSADLLDTLSYYDNTEPSWQEMPYFSIVESARGKIGIHIDKSVWRPTLAPLDESQGFSLLPGRDSSSIEHERTLDRLIASQGYRTILSGIGGDELLGGVPTPLPELAEYLVSGQLSLLFRRSIDWCLANRTPLLRLLPETAKFTVDLYRQPRGNASKMPPWLMPKLRKLCLDLRQRQIGRGSRQGFAPTALSNGATWWTILETLPHLTPSLLTRYEYRYPYLDRDLVDFLLRTPREQLLRPGERRSLMRRALKGIVPAEILARRRKGFLIRGPLNIVRCGEEKIQRLFARSLSAEHGFIDPVQLLSAVELVARGKAIEYLRPLLKATAFELWLRANSSRGASNPQEQDFMSEKQRAHKFPVNQIA